MAILVYSTPACPYCRMVRDYLRGKGVEFEEVDISEDASKAMELMERSGQAGVPVTDIGGELILGFDILAIDEALKKKGISKEGLNGYG